ncbi:MAG: hypothetical protein ACFCUU_09015 [Cyclobacteriaceae bacterium]
MKHLKHFFTSLILLGCVYYVHANDFEHPRGIITKADLPLIRERAKDTEFRQYVESILLTEKELSNTIDTNLDMGKFSKSHVLGLQQAFLYTLYDDKAWSEKAYENMEKTIQDTLIFQDVTSRGLNRATVLFNMAIVYDLCYPAWTDAQRRHVNEGLFYIMMTTNSNMGFEGNYNMASNWMGIRYAAVLLGSMVWDHFDLQPGQKSNALPFRWDAHNRLGEHINLNMNENGWNAESLSYMIYNWMFIAPAYIALQNGMPNNPNVKLTIAYPKTLNALWAQSTATSNIPNRIAPGMQPDLSDDDPQTGTQIFTTALKLYPEDQLPAIHWMFKYLERKKPMYDERMDHFLAIAYTPHKVSKENPATLGWLNYVDEEQGVVLFRNQFKDENDIIAAFTATARRAKGHQGPDNLTFRILGLGALWAVGGGRTELIAGQTNLFTIDDPAGEKYKKSTGQLLDYQLNTDGSGWAKGSGSCLGVQNHRRFFYSNYDTKFNAAATFIIADQSDNGERWRLNTAGNNTVETTPNGFIITAPNGSSMRATVFGLSDKGIETGKTRYGGDTQRLNHGIEIWGEAFEYNTFIDCFCNKKVTVVLTLAEKGQKHPPVALKGKKVLVNGKLMTSLQ